jgi:hypothetical protein
MSYLSTLLVQCEDFQDKLGNVWGKDASFVRDPIPFLEYVRSEENTNLVDVTVNEGKGKTMNVNLTYFQRIPESEVVEASERGCAVDKERGNCVEQYSIDTTDLVKSGEIIKAKALERFCQDNDEYIVGVIMRHLNAIDRKVASRTAAQAAALLGAWSEDAIDFYSIVDDKLTVRTKNADGSYLPGALESVDQAAMMSSFDGFIGFGGAAMNEYMRLTQAGCCSNSGLDVLALYQQYGYAFAYDRRLATALGGQLENLVIEPGAFQLLNYTQTPWKEDISIELKSGYEAIQLTTPAGVDVDVYIKDECPGEISINVFANTKLVGLPDDLFPVGDNFDGVNYAAQVTVDNS